MKSYMSRLTFVVSVLLLFVFLVAFSYVRLAGAQDSEKETGPNWDKRCDSAGVCTMHVYSYQKYWEESEGVWTPLDESFSDCSEDDSTRYCTQNYYYKAEADENGTVSLSSDGDSYSMKLAELNNENLSFAIGEEDGAVVYTIIPESVEMRYQYLPDRLKEEVFVYQPDTSFSELGLNLSFEIQGDIDSELAPAYICDSNYTCMDIEQVQHENRIDISVPASFFQLSGLVYPLIIDPTVTFNSTFISWNGYVINETTYPLNNFTRTSDPASWILAGEGAISFNSTSSYRGIIEWNLSAIPQGAVFYNATLQLRTEPIALGNPSYTMSFFALEHTHDYYADAYGDHPPDCDGNCLLYVDAGDGSNYGTESATGKVYHNYTLSSQALLDISTSLSSGIFGVGIDTNYTGTMEVGSKDNPTAAKRPVLTLVYGVNTTDSDAAIDEGILNSLGSGTSYKHQQVYFVDAQSHHYLGRFDRVKLYGNKTWALNYILPGESFTNIPSWSTLFNVWENQSLTYQQIVGQVSAFINSTKY
jgi:hypothetical protein